ncbi:MotA/TolQ/ExbB proton channel [Paraburkholderia hospita]|uniref:MotA/TolQ/ExbB proton channel n=1 Tax=Paraburkholderia hospita TaxID=169430 RepID=A0ABN0FH29_9BURK|nr:MotA/TolQ/ExbB proton channel [Paraburkholderia hospita]
MDDSVARMQSGLAILASIGGTAPFVGLFGSVWGIYHALLTIGAPGQSSFDQVAPRRRSADHDGLRPVRPDSTCSGTTR